MSDNLFMLRATQTPSNFSNRQNTQGNAMQNKRLVTLTFWLPYLLLFMLGFIRFSQNPSLVLIEVLLAELILPILLFFSYENLMNEHRMISAQFMFTLAITSVLTGALALTVTAPLTLLLSPEALRQLPASDRTTGAAYLISNKVYSLFDIMTFIGTLATLALVIMGSLIPEEARRHANLVVKRQERSTIVDDFIRATNMIFGFDRTSKDFDKLLLDKNRIWLKLLSLVPDDHLRDTLTRVAAEIDAALHLDHTTSSRTNTDWKTLAGLQHQVSDLVRQAS